MVILPIVVNAMFRLFILIFFKRKHVGSVVWKPSSLSRSKIFKKIQSLAGFTIGTRIHKLQLPEYNHLTLKRKIKFNDIV